MQVEFDLKEILVKLDSRFDKLDVKMERLEARIDRLEAKVDSVAADVNDLKTNLGRVETELKGEIRVLDEKVDGIVKRIDTQEFINRGVIVGLILAILGGFAKIFGLAS